MGFINRAEEGNSIYFLTRSDLVDRAYWRNTRPTVVKWTS